MLKKHCCETWRIPIQILEKLLKPLIDKYWAENKQWEEKRPVINLPHCMQDLILGNKYKNKKGLKASVKLWLVPFFPPGICSLFSELYIETNLPATFESLDTFNIWKIKKCPQISFKCLQGRQEPGRTESHFISKNHGTHLIVVSTRRPRQRKRKKLWSKRSLLGDLNSILFHFYVRISIVLKGLENALVIYSSFEVKKERWNFRFSKTEK